MINPMANGIDSINSVNFNIGSGSLAEGTKPALTAIRTVQGLTKKNSLSAMVKDLIMQYPMYIDGDIDTDTMAVIAKANEKQFAALQLALWSADTAFGIDPTSNGGVRDFIKKYHNNSDTPDLVSYTGNLVRNISNFRGAKESVDSSHVEVELTSIRELNDHLTKEALESLWETVEDRITIESVNDLYLPAKVIVKKMDEIASAMEASNKKNKFKKSDKGKNFKSYMSKNVRYDKDNDRYYDGKRNMYFTADSNTDDKTTSASNSPDPKMNDANTKQTDTKKSEDFFDDFHKNMKNVESKNSTPKPFLGKTQDKMESYGKSLNNAKFVNADKKLTALEPTLLEVEFFVRNPGGGSMIKKAIIGVKVMPRIIPSGPMAANVIYAIQGSHKAFQFVKWTRGETKFIRDIIFNISQIKNDAITKDRFQKYFGAMRKRKNNFRTFKFGDSTVNPFTTIVLSMNTVERIKQTAGYDLTDPNVAKKFMNTLFLLGFQIVDTNTGVVSTMLDDWNYFTDSTIDSLRDDNKRDADKDMMRELLRLTGRSM